MRAAGDYIALNAKTARHFTSGRSDTEPGPGQGAVLRIDPPVHSEGSYDGHEPVELLLEHASDIGLDGVIVTDHDEIDESLRAAEMASEYGLVGIPGVEVNRRYADIGR